MESASLLTGFEKQLKRKGKPMKWDPKRRIELDEFRRAAMFKARQTFCGELRPTVSGVPRTPMWFWNKEVRIFWEDGIEDRTAVLVKKMAEKRIAELGFTPLTVLLFGKHDSVEEEIALSLVNGELDPDRLFEQCLGETWRDEKRGGRQHADIIITRRQFVDDAVSWGAASFEHGTMVFVLHGQRQHNRDFFSNVALHEMNHLLGMAYHCDVFQNVGDFEYDPQCNMHYHCGTPTLCPKCIEFIRSWWIQIQHESGKL